MNSIHSNKARRMIAAGMMAAALAVASLGSIGVSASPINDDDLGSATVPQQVAVVPFTSNYTVNAVPFATLGAGQVDNSVNRDN